MSRIEAPSFHNLLEHTHHTEHEVALWTKRHQKPLSLTLAALGVAILLLVEQRSSGAAIASENLPALGRLYAPVVFNQQTVPSSQPTIIMCLQVITPAINEQTGEYREFPNSCLPKGWQRVVSYYQP